jgi:homoserine O-acetyltransferase/O-succinyltransferase
MRRCVGLITALAALQIGKLANGQTPPAPPLPRATIASLGTCRLASGATIENCRIAYRSFGRLNASRTNAVLIPTWLLGRSEDWIGMVGPNGWVDTTRFFTVVVDAFANGRSSSPSNSPPDEDAAFRSLTIGDMVDAQHRLAVEILKLPRLHAVLGISMGGHQAFEWAVRYPNFVDAVVPVVGSPQPAAFDQTRTATLVSLIENGQAHGVPDDSIWSQVSLMSELFLRTPRAVNEDGVAAAAGDVARSTKQLSAAWTLDDFATQLRASRRQNVAAKFGGDLARAAAQVHSRMLIIYSWDDHSVSAESAAAFAKYVHADTLSVASTCGHLMTGCEGARITPVVRAFLAR